MSRFLEYTLSYNDLYVGGFGWTGSGALIDYLSDFNVQYMRPDREETSFFKGYYSLSNISAKLKNENGSVPWEFFAQTIEYLRGEKGAADLVTPKKERPNIKRNEQLRYFLSEAYISEVDIFESEIKRYKEGEYLKINQYDFMSHSKIFYDRIKEAISDFDPSKVFVINNDPSGYSIEYFLFHDCLSYNVFYRSFLDVFADMIRLGKLDLTLKSAEAFVKAYRGKIKRFKSQLKRFDDIRRARIKLIHFESFVSSFELQEKWRKRATRSLVRYNDNYSAEASQKNIGIYKNLLTNDVIPLLTKLDEEWDVILQSVNENFPSVEIFDLRFD